MQKITESESSYHNLEKMDVSELLSNINREDKTVAASVEKTIPAIKQLVCAIIAKMKIGGRLFYLGSGTSGRLGIVDASECPPTYGVDPDRVIAIIAGGDQAIRKAKEHAEDDFEAGWNDLKKYHISEKDVVIGISASGTTPYVIGALQYCNKQNIITGSISCNPESPVSRKALYPIEVIVGPEFVTGSTRMKSGTAQKLILNMITTTTMIKLGHIKGNKMVDMKLSNNKLIERGTKMIMDTLAIPYEEAKRFLLEKGSVRSVIEEHIKK